MNWDKDKQGFWASRDETAKGYVGVVGEETEKKLQ